MNAPQWLAPYGPTRPLPCLVEEINQIFHAIDADRYENDHIEIRELWPALWRQMLKQLPTDRHWRILDYGCGTGFAAQQALAFLGGSVSVVMAYDPSIPMLSKARGKIGNDPRVILTSVDDTIWQRVPYNILLTNSVLHHMPDGADSILSLQKYLSHDAWWLVGNEPSARFYANPDCLRLFCEYQEFQAKTKWLRPARYLSRIRGILRNDTLSRAATAAHRKCLFAVRPDRATLARLVDFHVQHSSDDPRGFDLQQMQEALRPHWKMAWSTSYSYLGAFSELRAGLYWRRRAAALAARYPHDGANFCATFYRP